MKRWVLDHFELFKRDNETNVQNTLVLDRGSLELTI